MSDPTPPSLALPQEPPVSPAGKPTHHDALRSQFNVAFSLMSVIPLLICLYLLTVKFFTITILEGLNGVYLLIAVVIAVLGLWAGRQTIQDIIRQLEEINTKLQRLYEQQGAFVSNVAHEFRAPLTVIKGSLDNLADGLHGPISPDQQEPVVMCRRETGRLSRLVGDLLDIARMEAGKLRLTTKEVSLADLLKETAKLFEREIAKRGLSLAVDSPDEPAIIIGDRDRLEQVFVNLLGNAVKFTRQGGIRIRLRRDQDEYQIDVEDTGPGIAPEDLERIFDKFERVENQQSEEGSGLGLPIARDLVQLHKGRLWAKSQLGQGSRFIVRLPVAQRASPDAESRTP